MQNWISRLFFNLLESPLARIDKNLARNPSVISDNSTGKQMLRHRFSIASSRTLFHTSSMSFCKFSELTKSNCLHFKNPVSPDEYTLHLDEFGNQFFFCNSLLFFTASSISVHLPEVRQTSYNDKAKSYLANDCKIL